MPGNKSMVEGDNLKQKILILNDYLTTIFLTTPLMDLSRQSIKIRFCLFLHLKEHLCNNRHRWDIIFDRLQKNKIPAKGDTWQEFYIKQTRLNGSTGRAAS